jgi:uncharacterized membrane protein YfbV (UPF0208 family)
VKVNGLQLVDFLRETENKMLHLHKAIDRVSNEPDFKESVSVLNEVIKDYQVQIDKVKQALGNVTIGNPNQQQKGNS